MPSLADKANAMLDQMETTHDSQHAPQKELTTVDVVLADKLPQQTQEAPVAQTVDTPKPQITDDIEVVVKVDGKEQTVKLEELKKGYSRESTFTQRMQTLGEQRRQLENYFAQQQAQMNAQAQAVQLAQQQLQQFNQSRQQPVAPQVNPNDIATVGELQQYMQALAQQVQQARLQDQQVFQTELQKAQQQQLQELAVRRDQERFSTALDAFMGSDDGQLLAELNPFAADAIRFQVMQTSPDSMDEAIKNMEGIAKEWAQKVKGRVQTQNVRQEVVKARTVMEPPVGTPAATISQPKPSVFRKDGGVDYNALFQRSLSLMD
jgi:hypothetical protein